MDAPSPPPLWLCLHLSPAEAPPTAEVASTLDRLTPHRVQAGPDELLLEIGGCLRLFGGPRRLQRLAHRLCRHLGRPVERTALAATPLASRLLARLPSGGHHRGVTLATTRRLLAAVPLDRLADTVLPATPETVRALAMLQALGARTLGDLHALPRAGLQQRGAADWLDALDRAEGRRPDPPHWLVETAPLRLHAELAQRADATDPIERAVAPLVAALADTLARRAAATRRVTLHLHPEHGARRALPPQSLTLDLAVASRDAAHLTLLLRERLLREALQAPVDAITLTLDRLEPDPGRPRSLLAGADPRAHDEGGLSRAELIDRLRARLGDAAVCRWQPQADTRPQHTQRRQPAGTHPAPPPPGPADATAPRPTWLLDPPWPLSMPAAATDVLHLHRPGRPACTLVLLTRAERIESGWHDGALQRRDYHVALADDGRLCWVGRDLDRVPDDPAPRWFVHGLFG